MPLTSAKEANLHMEGGNAARDRQLWLVAAEHYEKYLTARPGDSAIWVQLGHCRKESGAFESASEAYEKAIGLAPSDADAHLQLGHLRKLQKRFDDAILCYRKACDEDPKLEDAAFELSQLEAKLSRQRQPSKKLRVPAEEWLERNLGNLLEQASVVRALAHETARQRQSLQQLQSSHDLAVAEVRRLAARLDRQENQLTESRKTRETDRSDLPAARADHADRVGGHPDSARSAVAAIIDTAPAHDHFASRTPADMDAQVIMLESAASKLAASLVRIANHERCLDLPESHGVLQPFREARLATMSEQIEQVDVQVSALEIARTALAVSIEFLTQSRTARHTQLNCSQRGLSSEESKIDLSAREAAVEAAFISIQESISHIESSARRDATAPALNVRFKRASG
jgi:tetratricopeptide (TPR) repeat protein